jgi:hypothetical protein
VPTELAERRTERTRTIANPDGTFSLEVSQGRLNYKDGFGNWRPLDLSLVADRIGPYSLRVTANDATVRLGYSDAQAGLGQLTADGHTIGMRAFGYGPGSRTDNVVSFAGSGDDGKVGVQPTDLGFEFTVTLDNADQASVYHFAVDSGDLVPVLASDGQTILFLAPAATGFLASDEVEGGEIIGVISAPVMVEGWLPAARPARQPGRGGQHWRDRPAGRHPLRRLRPDGGRL